MYSFEGYDIHLMHMQQQIDDIIVHNLISAHKTEEENEGSWVLDPQLLVSSNFLNFWRRNMLFEDRFYAHVKMTTDIVSWQSVTSIASQFYQVLPQFSKKNEISLINSNYFTCEVTAKCRQCRLPGR